MAIVICIWNSVLKDLWGQLLTGKLTRAGVPWSFLLECQCRAPLASSPSASVLGSPAAVTPSWHPRPFPSGSHSTGLVPAVQPPHLHCRAGQVGTERCSGTEIKIYNSVFYRELPSPKWQENVAAPALHPAWNSLFSVLSNTSTEPTCSFSWKAMDRGDQEHGNLSFFSLKQLSCSFPSSIPSLLSLTTPELQSGSDGALRSSWEA